VTIAYVGLGSNLENPVAQVRAGFDELDRLPHSRVVKKSSLYRSAPVGYAGQPDFINAVAQLETGLPAQRLLDELHEIESRHGRTRSVPNAPRTLDLDLLMHGRKEVLSGRLTLPHPRMHERAFVLKPLLELSPQLEIPGRGPARAFLDACKDQKVEVVGRG
jgi:2-amino-4-hydroxy-6-hydroxymethyldihydropteridine diphosphokinase